MKKTIIICVTIIFCTITQVRAQKIISDCTIQYTVTKGDSEVSNIGSKTLYIKGKNLRLDLVTKTFNQTVFYDNNTGNVAVLKRIGDSKYISQFNPEEWNKENKIFKDLSVTLTNEVKSILGYNCKQAVIELKDGRKYTVYYVAEIIPSIAEIPFDTQNIPGLVLAYKSSLKNGNEIEYTAKKIDFRPVPAQQFNVPEQGYRILQNN